MLRKDFLVAMRHPFLLTFEILIPAFLFLTICDNRFIKSNLKSSYDPLDLSLFDLSKRFIGYHEPNNISSQQRMHLQNIMGEMAKLYEPHLDST